MYTTTQIALGNHNYLKRSPNSPYIMRSDAHLGVGGFNQLAVAET